MSCPTRRAAGRRHLPRSTACRVRASDWRCGANRQQGSRSGCEAISPRRSAPPPTAATRPYGVSRTQGGRLLRLRATRPRRTARRRSGRALLTLASQSTNAVCRRVPRRGWPSCARSAAASRRHSLTQRVAGRARTAVSSRSAPRASASACVRSRSATLAETLSRELEEARAIARRGGLSPAELETRANDAAAQRREPPRSSVTTSPSGRARPVSGCRRSSARSQTGRESHRQRAPSPPPVRRSRSRPSRPSRVPSARSRRPSPGALRQCSPVMHARARAARAHARDGLGSLTVIVDREPAPATEPPVKDARPLRALAAGDPAALRLLDGVWLVEAGTCSTRHTEPVITIEGSGYDTSRGRALVRRRDRRGGAARDGRSPSRARRRGR